MVAAARGQSGFTYVWVLLAVALTSAAAAAGAALATDAALRNRDRQFAWAGEQYRIAIASYYESSPGAVKRYPRELSQLLRDERFPVARRHLRDLYPDPLAPRAGWAPVSAPDGGIMGVRSSAVGAPGRWFVHAPAPN